MTKTKYRQRIEEKLDAELEGLPTLNDEQRSGLLYMIFELQDKGRANAWTWNEIRIMEKYVSKVWWMDDNKIENVLPPPPLDAEEDERWTQHNS